jgi:hypothetical protein
VTYKLCKRLVALNKLTLNMLQVYFAAGRITKEQYNELKALIENEGDNV